MTERAYRLGFVDSQLGQSPLERAYRPHLYYNYALSQLNRVEEAIKSCEAALAVCPEDPGSYDCPPGMLVKNLKVYRAYLESQKKTEPRAIDLTRDEDVETPPRDGIPYDAQVVWAVQLWKQIRDPARARAFLATLPEKISEDVLVAKCDAVSARRASPGTSKASVVFWAGPAFEPWGPKTPETVGIGGSETAMIAVAEELAKRGYEVTVYNDLDQAQFGGCDEGLYRGVRWIDYRRFAGCRCDVFVSSRQPQVVDHPIEARAKFLWVHDVTVGPADPAMHSRLLRFDRILALSAWHRDLLITTYPFLDPAVILQTRNGIDPERFAGPMPEKKNRLLFTSSPNRGVEGVAREVLPRVRARVPDAELHVYYGFDCWEKFAALRGDKLELAEIARLKEVLARSPGVVVHGRTNQRELARAMLEAKVWCYPTGFTETSCITAMEMMAAGCVPVATALAALPETVKHGILLDPSRPWDDYANETISLLTDETRRFAIADAGRDYAGFELSWKSLVDEWVEMFANVMHSTGEGWFQRYRRVA